MVNGLPLWSQEIVARQLLAHEGKHGAVINLVFGSEGKRRATAAGQTVYIVLVTHMEGTVEKTLLQDAGIVHTVFDSDVDLLPEARNRRHTRGVGLAHSLLYLLGIGVDNQLGANRQAEVSPTSLEDVGEGQEVDDAVVFRDIDKLIVGGKSRMILPVGEHHALALASSSTGVEDVAEVGVVGLLPARLEFRLAGQPLAQLDEVAEVKGIGVVGIDIHAVIIDDDALERGAEVEDAQRLVILVLLAYEEEAHLGIVEHIEYLLFAVGGVERHGNGAHTVGTEVGVEVLHTVL